MERILKTVAPTNDWSKAEVDLSAYAGQAAVKVRVAYENSASSADDMKAMGLKLDTFEIFEDGVRTFSDLLQQQGVYWRKVSYGDEAPIETQPPGISPLTEPLMMWMPLFIQGHRSYRRGFQQGHHQGL